MRILLAIVPLGCIAAVSARPIFQKRQDLQQPPTLQQQPINDVLILQFALSLEHLEAEFYLQGLNKFSEADFRRENIPNPTQTFQNFHHILQHEVQHVKTLQTVITSLGGTPVPPCEYKFPFQTVRQFMAVANNLEKVGVSAYNGALAIMESGDLQTAAATIDTVEARHASFLQTANGGDPFPENFDVALDGRQVITLASPFIETCSFDLGFVPFGQLQIKKQIQLPESDVEVAFQPLAAGQQFCNWLFSDQSIVVPLNGNLCKIPLGARGDIYLMITNDQTPVSLKKTDTIVAGPAIVTVDTAHTDSCKELFSGKKLKEGKLNEPMDHGPIPMNNPSDDSDPIPEMFAEVKNVEVGQPPAGDIALPPLPSSEPARNCGQAQCGQPPAVPPPPSVEPAGACGQAAQCGQPPAPSSVNPTGSLPTPEPSTPTGPMVKEIPASGEQPPMSPSTMVGLPPMSYAQPTLSPIIEVVPPTLTAQPTPCATTTVVPPMLEAQPTLSPISDAVGGLPPMLETQPTPTLSPSIAIPPPIWETQPTLSPIIEVVPPTLTAQPTPCATTAVVSPMLEAQPTLSPSTAIPQPILEVPPPMLEAQPTLSPTTAVVPPTLPTPCATTAVVPPMLEAQPTPSPTTAVVPPTLEVQQALVPSTPVVPPMLEAKPPMNEMKPPKQEYTYSAW